jgi:hypothetical protein
MNGILDNFLVGLALGVSALYAALSLGPKSLRRGLLSALGRAAARAPAFLRLRRAAQWFAVAAAGKAQGACGGCDTCGSEQTDAQKPQESEVKVPIAQIGRRSSGSAKPSQAAGSGLQ